MAAATTAAAGDLPDWLDAEDVLGDDDDALPPPGYPQANGQGRDAAPPMWQVAQEGYNDGGGGEQRALAIASSTSNVAAAAAPPPSSTSSSPEDAAFADVLAETMQGHLSPAEAVREYALICERAADAARREAQEGLSSAAAAGGAAAAASSSSSAAALRAAAARSSALESEAATWRLLSWLHGDPDPCVPAGRVIDAFSKKAPAASASPSQRLMLSPASSSPSSSSLSSLTGAQRAALAIASDTILNRLARVVAWLEASAKRALTAEDEGAAAAGGVAGGGDALLFPGDGLPRDTGMRSRIGTELDPDAGTRALLGAGVVIGTGGASTTEVAAATTQVPQHWSRADDEASARLCSRLRCLLRAGRGRDAVALCARVGAHWRGVSLGSASGPGLVALGEEVEVEETAENENENDDEAADALAAEADLGAGSLRALWRSAAAAAAASASATASAAPPGSAAAASATAEAALYGVLGGDPAAALLLLPGGDGRTLSSAAASDFSSPSAFPSRPSPWHDALWVLARCWLEAEVDAVVSSSKSNNDNRRCEGVVAGSQAKKAWPPRHLADAVPRSPGELLSAAAAASSSSRSGAFGGSMRPSSPLAAAEAHRGAQEALVAGGEALLSFVADRLPRWAGAGGGEGGDEAEAAAAGRLPGGGNSGIGNGGARFAAHFALALADLRLIPDPADPLPPPAAARRVVDAANAAIALHCVALIDCGGSGSGGNSGGDGNASADFVDDAGSLLPPLAARAAAPFRRDIIGLRLRTLREAPAEDAARALESLDQWLQGWYSAAAAASPSPSSSSSSTFVVSDISPREMERHAAAAASAGRSAGSSREGPAGRAAAARWLWLIPTTLPAAAEHSCRVLRELYLSGGAGSASAARALLDRLPVELVRVVELPPSEILAAAEEIRRGGGSSLPSSSSPSSERARAALSALAAQQQPSSSSSSSSPAPFRRGTVACLAELAAWRALFLADRAWRAWRADYAAVEAGRRAQQPPPASALERLRAGAEALAEDLPALVASGWLQGCVGKGDTDSGSSSSSSNEEGALLLLPREPAPDGEPGEVVLELLLELLPSPPASDDRRRRKNEETHADDDDDSRYRLSSPEACAAGAAALSASLSAALPEGVVATAAPAEGLDSGLVAVRVRLAEGTQEGADSAASAAVVVKGALAAPATSSHSSASHAPAPPRIRVACLRAASGEAARALCCAVALPSLLLRAAAAREAAVALGSSLDPGTAAIELAADPQIAPLFSRGEVQSLLERERRTVISAMVNDEARG